jgi:hypothetical protein
MQNHTVTRLADLATAIVSGEEYLLRAQSKDGCWRDYHLAPGSSEAWTTATIGWTLAQAPMRTDSLPALRLAADALHSLRKPAGWGYNRDTAADADSTAWAWRFLAILDEYRGVTASSLLLSYLDESGHARTFLHKERHGTWAHAHADVTPLVGLALLAAGADASHIRQVRQASLAGRTAGDVWHSFWWSTDSYAIACNLEFLAASGGVPREVHRAACEWLRHAASPCSSWESAQHLNIAASLEMTCTAIGKRLLETVLSWQQADKSWPASRVLLVPDQHRSGDRKADAAYEDQERLMSTAAVVAALKRWLLAPTARRATA